jgi:hypothetical protein
MPTILKKIPHEAVAISFAGNFNMHIVIKMHPVIHFSYFFFLRLSSYVRRMLYGWIRIYIYESASKSEKFYPTTGGETFLPFFMYLFFYADFIFIIDIVIIYYGTFDTDIRGKAKRTMTSCLHSNFCFFLILLLSRNATKKRMRCFSSSIPIVRPFDSNKSSLLLAQKKATGSRKREEDIELFDHQVLLAARV